MKEERMVQQTRDRTDKSTRGQSENLQDSPMMARLMENLEQGTDIGHYGRLTFAMIARHFLDEEELVRLLANQPDHGEDDARKLVMQVKGRDYNPPKRDRILQWQAEQDFAICPTPDDPSSCNVYSELKFPDDVYENIGEFWEEKAEATSSS
jgi:DNA primase large subunit